MNQNKTLSARELVALLKLKYAKPSSLLSVGLIEQFLNEHDECPLTHDQFSMLREFVRNGFNYLVEVIRSEDINVLIALPEAVPVKGGAFFSTVVNKGIILSPFSTLDVLKSGVVGHTINIKELLIKYKQLGTLAWEKDIILGEDK